MQFVMLEKDGKEKYLWDIRKMMEESDRDFIPPLSERSSTTQKNLRADEKSGQAMGISAYLNEMLGQKILACIEDDKLVGFVSFKENYVCDNIPQDCLPNIYLSTLIVSAKARGKGITTRMYDCLFNEIYREVSVFTRTWSTNIAHIKILQKFGFAEIARIKNHRGEGIDTVYFANKR